MTETPPGRPCQHSAVRPIRRPHALPAAALAACCLIGPAIADPLPPAWTWTAPADIEWIEPVPTHALLLVATATGHVHVLNARSGANHPAPPLAARPGVAYAGAAPEQDLACCHDRLSVYAIELESPARLRWQVDAWQVGEADAPQAQRGDPEDLRRLLAAQSTPDGVLIARDDGRVGCLELDSGTLRWQHRLGNLTDVQIRVAGPHAALLWRRGPEVGAKLLDLADGEWESLGLSDETPWPLWSGLANRGLVCAYPDGITLSNLSGTTVLYTADEHQPIRLASLSRCRFPSADRRGTPHDGVIFATAAGRWQALDLETGASRWTIQEPPPHPTAWVATHVTNDLLITTTARVAEARAITTGHRVFRFESRAADLLAVHADGPAVSLLSISAPKQPARPTLTVATLPDMAGPLPELRAPSYQLDCPDPPTQFTWIGDTLVLATKRALHAFTRPNPNPNPQIACPPPPFPLR